MHILTVLKCYVKGKSVGFIFIIDNSDLKNGEIKEILLIELKTALAFQINGKKDNEKLLTMETF